MNLQNKTILNIIPLISVMLIVIILGNYLILRGYTDRIVSSTFQSNLDLLYVIVSDARLSGEMSNTPDEETKEQIIKEFKGIELRVGRIQPVIIRGDGEVIYHPFLFSGENVSDREYFQEMTKETSGKITYRGNIEITSTSENWDEELILAYKYFKPWDYYIAIIDRESFYYSGLNLTATFSVVIAVISVILLVFVTIINIHRILGPIRVLTETASAYSEGEFSLKVDIESGDEIELLGNTFNKMSDDIVRQYSEIEVSKENLHQTLTQLSESERLATIGGLVGGLTHDLMTPLGISLTASSHLDDNIREIKKALNNQTLKKSELEEFFKSATESSQITTNNIHRAVELTQSFKQVAVDQGTADLRIFNVRYYIDNILLSLKPKFKGTKHTVTVDCDKDLEIHSYPGAFSQILTNLVLNSLIHAFEGIESGEIKINIFKDENTLHFDYSDNGRGIPKENLEKLFDEYFTTKKGRGGTGLGTNLIYSIVTKTLEGSIKCESTLGEGTTFYIKVPLNASILDT